MPVCEILSIGTELLLGQILNTNAQFLSQELALVGVYCYFQTTVGDNKPRIIDSLRQALDRADIVLITGGLGPTADDLTTECVAETFGKKMIFDQEAMARIEDFFRQRGYSMPETNRKQALRPEGSDILPNPRGTAPGMIWQLKPDDLKRAQIKNPDSGRLIMTFPGVPSEMKAMWKETAVPFLIAKFGDQVLWSCELKHYGIGESALAEKYAHLLDLANPTVAPYAGAGECRLRVTARGSTINHARQVAQPIIDEIILTSGKLCYGFDNDTLESVVGSLLKEKNLVVSLAESCTGGWVSKRLTDISGSSAYIKLNLVTYANEMKEQLLHVSHTTLSHSGAVSEECAIEMAKGARKLAGADIAVSVTGIAGPTGGTPDKPVGLVYFGIDDGTEVAVTKLTLPSHLPREEIRYRSASEALNILRLSLLSR